MSVSPSITLLFLSPTPMSKIFLGLAALLLLVSGGLSFLNKGKLTASLDDAKTAHSDAAAAHADATKSKTAMTKAQSDAKDAAQRATDAQSQLAGVQSQVGDLTAKVEAANKAAADKDAQIAAVNKQLSELSTKPGGGTSTPEEIAKQIDDLKRSRDELQVVKDGLENNLKAAQNQVAESSRREAARISGVSMNGLRGRVLAVDRSWNFVVLNLGDRNGVNSNATMIIQRGGSLVGKVRITSVEPSQSIADIIPNSVPAGISVQEGDTVVYPGS